MIGLIRIKYEGWLVPGMTKREVNRVLKELWHEVGVMWHRDFRPKHFTHAGAREYGYAPRQRQKGKGTAQERFNRSYTGQKLRKKGHTLPLVWSGESRGVSRVRDVRATSKGVRIVMRTNKLNYRYSGSKINMAAELRTISESEHRQIVAFMQERFPELLNAARASKVVTLQAA